jgi:hypothetical protein
MPAYQSLPCTSTRTLARKCLIDLGTILVPGMLTTLSSSFPFLSREPIASQSC